MKDGSRWIEVTQNFQWQEAPVPPTKNCYPIDEDRDDTPSERHDVTDVSCSQHLMDDGVSEFDWTYADESIMFDMGSEMDDFDVAMMNTTSDDAQSFGSPHTPVSLHLFRTCLQLLVH